MNTFLNTCYFRSLVFASLGLLSAIQFVEAQDKDPLFPGPVRPGLDYRTPLSAGYLEVYSATDRVDDGGVSYFPHSSYLVYTIDGKLVRKVENHVASSDESPELVTLPPGRYIVEARSENDGNIRVHVVVFTGRRAVLDLENGAIDIKARLARAKHLHHLANR
jgi:hypothetical protein